MSSPAATDSNDIFLCCCCMSDYCLGFGETSNQGLTAGAPANFLSSVLLPLLVQYHPPSVYPQLILPDAKGRKDIACELLLVLGLYSQNVIPH